MTRRKVQLAWITNESARKASLKKRRMGLLKKVNELAILCDLKACLIIFSPEDAEPLVWPSPEVARGLIDRYFALPDIERNKKATNQEAYLREKISKLQEQVNKIQKKNKEIEMEHLIHYLQHGRSLTDLSPNEAHGLIWYTREKIHLLEKRSEIISHVPLRDPPPAPIVPAGEGISAAAEGAAFTTDAEAAVVAAPMAAPRVPGGEGSSGFGVSNYPTMVPQNQYLMDQWFISKTSQPPLPTAQTGGHHRQVGTEMVSFHHENANYMSLIREMGIPSHQYGSFIGGQASGSGSNPNMEVQLMSSHESHESSFYGPFGFPLHQQPPHHGSMTMNPSQGIQMGLGHQPQGCGGYHPQHQIMPAESHFRLYPPNLMAGRFGFAPQGGGEGTSYQRITEKALHPTGSGPGSSWMGMDLQPQRQPHYGGGETGTYGGGQGGSMVGGQPGQPFGLFGGASTIEGASFYSGGQGGSVAAGLPGQQCGPFGGASTSGGGGGGIFDEFDISKTYCPDGSKNKDPANQ